VPPPNMALIQQLTRLENLFWAWEKAKASYSFDKTWYDEMALSHFEGNLRANLLRIQKRFQDGEYQLEPARLVAFPSDITWRSGVARREPVSGGVSVRLSRAQVNDRQIERRPGLSAVAVRALNAPSEI